MNDITKRTTAKYGEFINLSGKPLSVALLQNGVTVKYTVRSVPALKSFLKEKLIEIFYTWQTLPKIELNKDKSKITLFGLDYQKSTKEVTEETSNKTQFISSFSPEEIENIARSMDMDILENPTYPAITKALMDEYPFISKRQVGKIRESIIKRFALQ